MSHPWNQLVAAAVVGTERSQTVSVTPMDDLTALLSRISADDRERAVLDTSAALALWRRAGLRPHAVTDPLPAAAPPETLPDCDDALRRALHVVLREELYREVVPELLADVKRRGCRVPDLLLPALLDLGAKQPALWPVIEPVIGARGHWLARQNPAWAKALGGDDQATWEHGTSAQRRFALRRLRERDPDHARELLAASWQGEDPRDRAPFVAALEQGLDAADEAFLEHALDDRRKEVRVAAAELLSRLPTSGLVARMIERLAPLLRFGQAQRSGWLVLSGKRRATLDVSLPDACSRELQRDGIDQQPVRSEYGEKARWLLHMLAAIPPSHWTTTWNAAPTEILIAASASEWNTALLEGLAWATRRFNDRAWATAFFDDDLAACAAQCKDGRLTSGWLYACVDRHDLIRALPPDQREDLLSRLCRSRQAERRAPFWMLLRGCEHAWSESFSRLVLDELRSTVAADKRPLPLDIRSDLSQYARCFAPQLWRELRHGWPEDGQSWKLWQSSVANMAAIVEFRASFRSTSLWRST